MPDDSGAAIASSDSSPGAGPQPSDTLEILTGRTPSKGPPTRSMSSSGSDGPSSGSGSSPGDSGGSGGRAGSMGGSFSGTRLPGLGGAAGGNLDTLLGHMVVEQGLATLEEVEEAARSKAAADPASGKTLAQSLVEKGIVTEKQLSRLRTQAEAERSQQQIPGYVVQSKLGAGAMAAVFKAKQLSLDRIVAIKVLPRKFGNNRQFIERFYAEGRAAAQLNHPNIVQAYDVGQAGEFHYFVMEYVDGQTVHDLITQNKRFNEAEALDIIINVADALRHAHEKGLIHRDVKPKNIMFTPQGVTKLADLGLARAIDDKEAAMAEKGKAYGTPYYISPEQIRGELNIGPQADIYSLGATLYHMVTGNVPFNGKNPTEVMQKHLKTPLVPPDHVNPKLSAGISEVIEMMMAKSRRQRYKNAADLLVDLRAVRRGELPPIAHKEASVAALTEVAQSERDTPTTIVEDRSRQPSPFNHPSVQKLVWFSVAVTIIAVVMTIIAVSMMAMGRG